MNKTEPKLISCDQLLEALNNIWEKKFNKREGVGREVNEEGIAFNQISYSLLYIMKQNDRLCKKCEAWFQILSTKINKNE